MGRAQTPRPCAGDWSPGLSPDVVNRDHGGNVMRKLNPGDVVRKLARIEVAPRSRRWKKRATAKLLKDIEAVRHGSLLNAKSGIVCTKRRYPGFTQAVAALMDTWRSSSAHRREKNVYKCPFCKGWHLTSFTHEHTTGVSTNEPETAE